MKHVPLVAAVCLLFLAMQSFAGLPADRSARDLVESALTRAVSLGDDALIPKARLAGAAVGEVYYVHHPETMEPVYGLVPVRDANGDLVCLVGIDAHTSRCLWYNFHFPFDDFPPVPAREAASRVAAARRATGLEEDAAGPVLTEGCDRNLYWRFTGPGGENWLIDAVRTEADVLGSLDGSDAEALRVRAVRGIRAEGGPSLKNGLEQPGSGPLEDTLPASYEIPGIPYHFQITSWYCGPSSLQMIMDYHGEEIGQHNIADVANDIVDLGTYSSDMRRAAHFSGMSVAAQDPSLQGYTERKLGYACVDASIMANPAQKLKNTVYAQYPMFVLTWFSGAHTAGHYRVVKGYDDSLDVFIMHDPWYYGGLCGPDLIVDQSFFVDDLWAYSGHWGMVVSPWVLRPTIENSVDVGDTFTVDLEVYYPGPTRFGGMYECTGCEASINLSSGLSLAGGSPTLSLPDMVSDDVAHVAWDVVALGPEGEWGMSFSARGILEASSTSYPSYTDSIGGHAFETVTVGGTALAGWSAEERLTFDDGSSQTCPPGGRAMAAEPGGTIHLVWADTRDDTGEIYYRKRSEGVWEPEVRLTNDPGYSLAPCVAVGPGGEVHVAWVDWRDGNQEIYYKRWDQTEGWSADERVTYYGEVDCNPAIAAADTAVFLAWESRQGGGYRVSAVQFAWRNDSGWSVPMDVDASPARDSYRPSVALGADGLVHLVYERQTANDPDENEKVVHRSWNGSAWSGRTGLSTSTSFSRNPSIAAGADSSLHVVWQDGENISTDIFYIMYGGSAWQAVEQAVTGGFEVADPRVAVDGLGGVHLTWSDHRHNETEIYYMNKGGSGWSGETRITRAPGASVLPAAAADAAGRVSLVWTDLRNGNADLYFIETDAQSGVDPGLALEVTGSLRLGKPYPMPFTSEAHLVFALAEPARVSVDVFDVKGRLVRALGSQEYAAGSHIVTWDGLDERGAGAASGVYFVRCATPLGRQVRSMILIR